MELATAAQMKELDRQAIEERGIPSIELMDRAAEGVAAAALELLPDRPTEYRAAVFGGAGNNGGDGIAAARLLHGKGVCVRVFLAGSEEKLTPDAREETRRLAQCGVELERFEPENAAQIDWVRGCHVLIDALFGVGLSRPIDPASRYAAAIRLMNDCAAPVVSADIASGVEADSGRILGCAVRADKTVTFTFMKEGQAAGDGALCSGEVQVWDIGIPTDLKQGVRSHLHTVDAAFAREALPPRKPDGHKGDFGKVLIVGGAVGYTGAPYLTAQAAVRSGCGLVWLGVPQAIWAIEAVKCVSAMPFPLPDTDGMLNLAALPKLEEKLSACDVLALGPGLGRGAETEALVCRLLETERAVVLDADGINALAGHIDVLDRRRDRVTILTPHDGEFARLGGDLSHGDRIRAARDFAVEHGCILVLKGYRTVTAAPDGTVLVNTTGNSALAKGGSGDVLTGIIASLLAQGAAPVQAAALGVWLHGRAGDLAAERMSAYAVTPEDVTAALGEAFLTLQRS
ncbi:MAG: NAD(P)H-hydrate dehydratase [Ruminococcaceae bacterium]|nr:NAD(P)H-hydrate dehydratase [Oscillospiraceae bacterium]